MTSPPFQPPSWPSFTPSSSSTNHPIISRSSLSHTSSHLHIIFKQALTSSLSRSLPGNLRPRSNCRPTTENDSRRTDAAVALSSHGSATQRRARHNPPRTPTRLEQLRQQDRQSPGGSFADLEKKEAPPLCVRTRPRDERRPGEHTAAAFDSGEEQLRARRFA
jgi:hypothetical protein